MSAIKLGIRWPDYEVPITRATVRNFVEAAEELGYDHVTAFDHLAGMSHRTRRGWHSNYTVDMEWAETLTLFSFMGALSTNLGFLTAILGLAMRPTLLVAKQAATIDRLTEGRLRLGVGIGWNEIEFEMMGANYADRPARFEEQIAVLRKLWTKEEVLFRGEFHQLPWVGLSLAPVQRPIPIWMAVGMDGPRRVLRRVARLADGIIPEWPPGERTAELIEQVRVEAKEAGRDPAEIGIEPRIALKAGKHQGGGITIHAGGLKSDEDLAEDLKTWAGIEGITHVEYKTRSCGLATVGEHIREMTRFMEVARSVLT